MSGVRNIARARLEAGELAIGMGLRQSDTELRDKFDAVITEMKEDGSLNELIVKWFGDDALTFE